MRPLALLLSLVLACAAQADPVTERGRAIYAGDAGSDVQVRVGDRLRPARGITCAGCHGHDAEGGAEVQSGPAIDWSTLIARGYTEGSFVRALTQGVAPDGTPLVGAMPRLAFRDPQDVTALVAFLRQIRDEQRIGITDDSITFQRPPPHPALAPFWQAFQAQLTALAPLGIYGRRIRLAETAGFARIGALRPDGGADQPSLFPLHPLVGDEDPARIRGGFATLAAQVLAVAERHPRMALLADPGTLERLAGILPDRGIAFVAGDGPPRRDHHLMVLGADLLRATPRGPTLATTLDDLALALPPGRGCIQATDPRPGDAGTESAMIRYGRTAATVLTQALRLCGADCTRAGLMRAFDRIEAISPADWPDLDYTTHPLTGTDQVRILDICNPADAP